MIETAPRAPAWLAILLLLASSVGFVAACVMAVMALGSDRSAPLTTAALACLPPIILGLVAFGTRALRRGNYHFAVAGFLPPIALGAAFLVLPYLR